MRVLVGLSWAILITFNSRAQFKDSTHYYVYYNGTGNFNQTNASNSTVFSNVLKFSISKKTVALNITNSYIYGVAAGLKTNSDFSTSEDFDYWRPNQKLYYWALAAFDKSFSLKINHRLQAGGGLGYTVVNAPRISLILSDGILYEWADLTDAELGQLNYSDFRNSFRVKFHWVVKDILVVDQIAFWQPSLSNVHDVIYKNNTTVAFKLKKWLSLTAAYTYNAITITHRENSLLTFGVVVEKYF